MIPIKLIQPGWGSSGYWSEEVLKRDGATAFPSGTHMYINHQSMSERIERPERDVKNLAGVTTSDPTYQENGPDGPGLYANAKVFSTHQDWVSEVAEHIGLSIVATGEATHGEAEGREGNIIQSLAGGHSVDFVTKAGAGGKILFESAGTEDVEIFVEPVNFIIEVDTPTQAALPLFIESEVEPMAENNDANQVELDRLLAENAELKTELVKAKHDLIALEASRLVTETLAGDVFSVIPASVRSLIGVQATSDLPMTEAGQLDRAMLIEAVTTTAEGIVNDMPKPQAQAVTGNGTTAPVGLNIQEANDTAIKLLVNEGHSETAARKAVLLGAW